MTQTLLIYDCDGTLIDTETICAEVCLAAIHRLGLTGWTMERYLDTFVGMPADVGWGQIAALAGGLPEGFNTAVDAEIERRFLAEMRVLPGTEQAVSTLAGPRCVASSTALPSLRRNLHTAGLIDLFDPSIFSASQVKRGKPAPDVFLFAASQMGFDPAHCLVIEDSVPGVTAARRAGMTVIGFTGAAHDPERLARRLGEAGAAAIVPGMAELASAVRGLGAR
jgi:HAD superfamily hydrolase (TIGR01509 family)